MSNSNPVYLADPNVSTSTAANFGTYFKLLSSQEFLSQVKSSVSLVVYGYLSNLTPDVSVKNASVWDDEHRNRTTFSDFSPKTFWIPSELSRNLVRVKIWSVHWNEKNSALAMRNLVVSENLFSLEVWNCKFKTCRALVLFIIGFCSRRKPIFDFELQLKQSYLYNSFDDIEFLPTFHLLSRLVGEKKIRRKSNFFGPEIDSDIWKFGQKMLTRAAFRISPKVDEFDFYQGWRSPGVTLMMNHLKFIIPECFKNAAFCTITSW